MRRRDARDRQHDHVDDEREDDGHAEQAPPRIPPAPEGTEKARIPPEMHEHEHDERDAEHLMHAAGDKEARKLREQQHEQHEIEERTFLHLEPFFLKHVVSFIISNVARGIARLFTNTCIRIKMVLNGRRSL